MSNTVVNPATAVLPAPPPLPTYTWPPQPPDVSDDEFSKQCESQPFFISPPNSEMYKVKDRPLVYKFKGDQREYDLMKAAGDCAVKARGRVFSRYEKVYMDGYYMDLETPLDPKKIHPSERRRIMESMIHVVNKLHEKRIIHGDIKPSNMLVCSDGQVRLCDFAEGRYIDEDTTWYEGSVSANYLSPRRCKDWRNSHRPPPEVEDDLYALGLSIWELYTGKMPWSDDPEKACYVNVGGRKQYRQDDDAIWDDVGEGKTVDVNEVEDESVRAIILDLLRKGGAKV